MYLDVVQAQTITWRLKATLPSKRRNTERCGPRVWAVVVGKLLLLPAGKEDMGLGRHRRRIAYGMVMTVGGGVGR